ncbi:unnamed protein product [Prunus armeniaca]
MPALTSQNSGFSPGRSCPWACSGSWDPPPNRATGPALELPRAPSGSLSPRLVHALEVLLVATIAHNPCDQAALPNPCVSFNFLTY